jgi:hypothetical protein
MADDRLTEIEQRLTALERALAERPTPPGPAEPEGFWVLDGLAADAAALPGGAVVYAGSVRLPGGEEYAWQRTHAAGPALGDEGSDGATATAVAALGHPVRLRLLREVLAGRTTTAELATLPDLGTTGQLHHHLRQLVAAGWLRTTARGRYALPAERVVPLHVVLAAVTA